MLISAISGAPVAELHEEELFLILDSKTPVRALKEYLAAKIGISRFRQRLLGESGELQDDSPLKTELTLCLVVLDFRLPDEVADRSFIKACAANEVAKVERMLEIPHDPNTRNSAALFVASKSGHVHVVRILLEAGIQKDAARTFDGRTALRVAAEKGHLEVVRLLLDSDAAKDAAAEDGITALHAAAWFGHLEVMRLLLGSSADKDAATRDGLTALHIAALNCHTEVVRLLLHFGTDKDARTRDGSTALHVAAQHGDVDVAGLLLDFGADKDAVAQDGSTALHVADRYHHVEVARVLRCKRMLVAAST